METTLDRHKTREELLLEVQTLRRQVEALRAGAQASPAERASALRGQQVLDAIPSPITVFDRGLRLLYANPAAVPEPGLRTWALGREEAELERRLGRDPELARRRDLCRKRALQDRAATSLEEERKDRDGARLHLVTLHVPVIDPDGEVRRVISYSLDLTEQHSLQEQLRQTQKLEAIGKLAGGVAHDFNNLLTTVLGYAQIMKSRLPPTDPLVHHAQEIIRASERASLLTRQLLAFSRKQVQRIETLDLNEILTDMETLMTSTLGATIELRLDLDPDPVQVQADAMQLEQVLLNLTVNARDAMPGGGTFEIITTTIVVPAGTVDHEGAPIIGRFRRMTVTDTGLGMDLSTQRQIFEPFFTTKEPGQGTGLGLATVYGIVKQSHGFLTVKSGPGQGTIFEIYLPPAEQTEASRGPIRRSLASADEPPPGTETVLVVEDEEGVRVLARSLLEAIGYRVLEAADGIEALRLGNRYLEPIHLILADLVMPRLGGRDLVDHLVAAHPEARVLFMSGFSAEAAKGQGLLAKDHPFIAKPFRPDALARKIREVLDARPDQPTS